MNLKYLYHFASDEVDVVEVKRLDLPPDSPPGLVYHWLMYSHETQSVDRLVFKSMDASGTPQHRWFAQGTLSFDDSAAQLTLTDSGEHNLTVEDPDSVPEMLKENFLTFLQEEAK